MFFFPFSLLSLSLSLLESFRFPNITQIVIRGFMGTTEEAMTYLERGYYLGFTGYLCKVNSNYQSFPNIIRNSFNFFFCILLAFRINPTPVFANCSKAVRYLSNDFWLKVMHHLCIQIREHQNCRNTLNRPPQNALSCFYIGLHSHSQIVPILTID